MNALAPPAARAGDPPAAPDSYTVHDSRIENVALIVDAGLPWVVRRGGPLPIIVGRYGTQAEADCACLGARTTRNILRAPAAILTPPEAAGACKRERRLRPPFLFARAAWEGHKIPPDFASALRQAEPSLLEL